MATPTPPLTPPPDDDRSVMGDHPELETDETVRPAPDPTADLMSRLLLPGLAVLVIVVLVVLYFALWS